MTPIQPFNGPVIFHHTWIKYRFHRGALESGPQGPLCALHSLLQTLKAKPGRLPSGEGPCSAQHLSPFGYWFFCSCDIAWRSVLSNHGPLHILSFCTSVFWLCVCSLALAHNCPVLHPILRQQTLSRYQPSSNFDYLQKHSFPFLDLLSSTTGNVQFSLVYYILIFGWRNYFSPVDFLRRLIMNFCVKSHLPPNDECAPIYAVRWNCFNRITTLESLLPLFLFWLLCTGGWSTLGSSEGKESFGQWDSSPGTPGCLSDLRFVHSEKVTRLIIPPLCQSSSLMISIRPVLPWLCRVKDVAIDQQVVHQPEEDCPLDLGLLS